MAFSSFFMSSTDSHSGLRRIVARTSAAVVAALGRSSRGHRSHDGRRCGHSPQLLRDQPLTAMLGGILLICALLGGSVRADYIPKFEFATSFKEAPVGDWYGRPLVVDAEGNSYLTGLIAPGGQLNVENVTLTNRDDRAFHLFLAKLDLSGRLQWIKQITSPNHRLSNIAGVRYIDLATDALGNCYLSGKTTSESVNLGEGITVIGGDPFFPLGFVAKFASDGRALWSMSSFKAPVHETVPMAVTGKGACYAANRLELVRLTSSGLPSWSKSFTHVRLSDPFASSYITSVAVGPEDSVLVGGIFNGILSGDSSSITNGLLRVSHGFLAKFSSTGNMLWVRDMPDLGWIQSLNADSDGNIYLTSGPKLLALDAVGNLRWSTSTERDALGRERHYGLAGISPSGDIYGLGYHVTHPNDFGVWGLLVSKFAADGERVWSLESAAAFSARSSGQYGLAMSPFGDIRMAVSLWRNETFSPGDPVLEKEGLQIVGLQRDVTSEPPIVAHLSTNRTVVWGESTTLGVSAAGKEPLSYQWFRNGIPLARATNVLLTLKDVTLSDTADYSVAITNAFGSVQSSSIRVEVGFSLSIRLEGDGLGEIVAHVQAPVYPPGSRIRLLATPAVGSEFWRWLDTDSRTPNPREITLNANTTITGEFVPTSLTINVHGAGMVSRAPDLPYYPLTSEVTLTALPGRYHVFTGWSDGVSQNPRVVAIGRNNTYFANFVPTTDLETIEWNGLVRSAPKGMPSIWVNGQFVTNRQVRVFGEAHVEIRTTLQGGVISYILNRSLGQNSPQIYSSPFTVRDSSIVTASVWHTRLPEPLEADPVEIVAERSLSLTLLSKGGGTIYPGIHERIYRRNQTVAVRAEPFGGWEFLTWIGDLNTTSPTGLVVMDQDQCAEAVFGTPLEIESSPDGSSEVSPNYRLFRYGDFIRISAIPKPGNAFALWQGFSNVTDNPFTFEVSSALPKLQPLFLPVRTGWAALTIIPNGEGKVDVRGSKGGQVPIGTLVTLSAVASQRQEFLGWSGDITGQVPNLTFRVQTNMVIRASFSQRPTFAFQRCDKEDPASPPALLFHASAPGVYEIETALDLAGPWNRHTNVVNRWGFVQIGPPWPLVSKAYFRGNSVTNGLTP